MRLATYDCEVFAYDFLVTIKDKATGTYTCIWNDNEAVKACIGDDVIFFGFNDAISTSAKKHSEKIRSPS